jgi:hypothetical protein
VTPAAILAALAAGLWYVLPLLAFCGLAAVIVGALWPRGDAPVRQARRKR